MTEDLTFERLTEAVKELFNKVSNIERLLTEKGNESQLENDQILTVHEAANFLNLSAPTIYSYVQRAEIPVCKRKHTKRLYFSKQQLIDWIKESRRKTVSEIESEANNYLSNNKKRASNG